jgi:hypothetical protein
VIEQNDPALFIGKADRGTHEGEWIWCYDGPDGMEYVWVDLEAGTCSCEAPMCPHLRMVREKAADQ